MKISVCIATFNGERFIKKQLNSIVKQLSYIDEIIVSDDSSTDNTIAIIQSFDDSRIKLIENQLFNSPIGNFENAIRHSTGDLIFLADQDDVWLEGKVNIMTQALSDCSLVIADCNIIDDNDQLVEESFFKVNSSGPGLFRNLIKNSYLGCNMAFRRSIIEKALPFPVNIPMHDWWIGIVSEAFYDTKFINTPLIQYRRHGTNASTTGEKSATSLMTKIKYRIPLVAGLLKRY